MPVPKPIANAARHLFAFIKAIPLKLTIGLVIVASVVGEQFPLSPFPMYSTWAPDTYLVYFQDKNGEPIPIQKLTWFKAGRYRGMFEAELKKIKAENRKAGIKPDILADFGPDQYRRAGVHLLEWIDQNIHPDLVAQMAPLRPLQVVRREIKLEDGQLAHIDLVVATGADREPKSPAP